MEEDKDGSSALNPKCIASIDTQGPPESIAVARAARDEREDANSFKSAQWSPDGTCILTSSANNTLRTYILPADLLYAPEHHSLTSYSTLTSPEPVYASTPYPHFTLSTPSTTLLLSSIRDHPLRLTNALAHSAGIVASYPLVNPTTEAYVTPHALVFIGGGSHFVAGSESLLSVFDASRDGEGPVEKYPTIPSRRSKVVGGGVGMKGIISTIGVSEDGMLAAGTFTRSVGLYAHEGRGGCVAVFSVAADGCGEDESAGLGITQVVWSPCGRYLYVAERKSDGVFVYDIRVAGQRLGWLKGRAADTNQRLGIDVVRTAQGHEVWAGSVDGKVRVWSNPVEREGAIGPTFEWEAHRGKTSAVDVLERSQEVNIVEADPVCSTLVHPSGTVVATLSGYDRNADPGAAAGSESDDSDRSSQRSDDDEASRTSDSSPHVAGPYLDSTMKVWSL